MAGKVKSGKQVFPWEDLLTGWPPSNGEPFPEIDTDLGFVLALLAGMGPNGPKLVPLDTSGLLLQGVQLWVEGRAKYIPQAGTPHPFHLTASIAEVILPQDLSASSHPAAGSTASVTILNPHTVNQAGIAITGMTASLANAAVASAGQANNLQVQGSLGGAYTSETLVVPAVAFTIDRIVYRTQLVLGGNGVAVNTAEDFTVTFTLPGIVNLFQSINVYYHFGA